MADLKPCGTQSAYDRHIKYREVPDPDCCAANAKTKAAQGHNKARGKARSELVRLHPAEFAQLKVAQAAAKGTPRSWDRASADLARNHPAEFQRLLTDEFARQAIETP